MENYNQIKVLGKGAFGSAWLVQRRSDRKQFVAKEVRLANMKPAERESAKHEIAMLRKLDHPNITKYVDHFESRGSLFIVMEYANGGDLYTKIKGRNGRRFTEKEILHYFSQIALALIHLHDKKILHRDLKSQNVFLTQDGIVKLGDFGISTVLRNTYELKRTVCGTPYYFSPELCMSKPYNNKSDVWALGCILYELTTLTHAFDGNSMKALIQKILKGTYPPIHSTYSPNLAKLIAGTLKLDPAMRPNVHEIVASPYIREFLTDFKGNVEQANRDKRSCVDDDERKREQEEAARRARLEDDAKNARDRLAKEQAQRREAEKVQRIDDIRRQMEIRQKKQEEEMKKIHEQQAAQEAAREERKRQYEVRIREQRKIQAERDERQAKLHRQREEDWERNMAAQKDEAKRRQLEAMNSPSPQAYGAPQRAPPMVGGAEPSEAVRLFKEMRRQAEENRRRAEMDELPPPPPQRELASPVAEPVVERTPQKKVMSAAEMEEARRQAYWEMRRQAEENKRRLMGLDEPELQVANPAVRKAPSPPIRKSSPPPPVVSAIPTRAAEAPVQPVTPVRIASPTQPISPLQPEADDEDDTDGAAGLHRFLNNEVAAADEADNGQREKEYTSVTRVIDDALYGDAKPEDFGDEEDGDPTKFVMDGQTLHLPNCDAGHPLMSRIESLRMFLEQALGDANFFKAYRLMDDINDEGDSVAKVEALLPRSKHHYIPVISQLIVCEEYFNSTN